MKISNDEFFNFGNLASLFVNGRDELFEVQIIDLDDDFTLGVAHGIGVLTFFNQLLSLLIVVSISFGFFLFGFLLNGQLFSFLGLLLLQIGKLLFAECLFINRSSWWWGRSLSEGNLHVIEDPRDEFP